MRAQKKGSKVQKVRVLGLGIEPQASPTSALSTGAYPLIGAGREVMVITIRPASVPADAMFPLIVHYKVLFA